MSAPRDIVDALESLVSIYFSDVRHKHRAAFILTDELAEMTCKAKARALHPTLGRITVVPLLKLTVVGLDPAYGGLGAILDSKHNTRNQLQHVNAALSVDDQHCADAILDIVQTIDHCFPGSSAAFPDALRVELRVVRLHSTNGNPALRGKFEDSMRAFRWNSATKPHQLRRSEIAVMVGNRRYWGMVMSEYVHVESILNSLGIP